MTYYILITLCIIVLIAYTFEVTSRYTKIPGVILLMTLGIALKYFSSRLSFQIPDLSFLSPLMGTLGLILIVLDGSLDLTLSIDKKNLILKSFISAILQLVFFMLIFSTLLFFYYHSTIKMALINSIPLSIISGAVAIPSSAYLSKSTREFIIYESSISDIIGILFFNFVLINNQPIGKGILFFVFEVIVTIIFSVFISAGLAFLLHKIGHHVKYVIILTAVVIIYTLANLINWPSLLVVLIFGLIMNNHMLFQTEYLNKFIDFHEFNINLRFFKQITGELTFLVRSFFFLIFGFYTSLKDLLNLENLSISFLICFVFFVIRALILKFILHKPLTPLFYFAPRGLITILLFLSIPVAVKLPFMTEGLISQTIFISILVMAFGNIFTSGQREKVQSVISEN